LRPPSNELTESKTSHRDRSGGLVDAKDAPFRARICAPSDKYPIDSEDKNMVHYDRFSKAIYLSGFRRSGL
jgi:hypothetical protein